MDIKAILKEHAVKRTPANSIGICAEIFADWELVPTVKNVNKRVNLEFIAGDGTSINVVASRAVNDLYRAGKMTIRQMLGLPVYMTTTNAAGEPLTDAVTGNAITVFSVGQLRGATVGKVKDQKADVFVPEPIDLDALA